MSLHHDTIAALATPVGTAAIAVLRISGPDCARLTAEIFGETPPPRVARRGDYRDQAGATLDDVLFTFFAGPNSYTGENSLEISCHGNPFIAQKILEDLLARGCRAAGPGEFTQRAFLGGRMDLSQAEAVMDLIHARSERALAAANQQLRGALGRRLEELTGGLIAVLARVEAYIDFPDEDLPAEDREWVRREIARIAEGAGRLLATNRYGALLRDGIRTVIIGAPNAGKSSLLNRLVGSERALVSPEPGTTRDFIEERVTFGSHWLRLIDTAGLNPSPAPLERMGIAKTIELVADADLILLVLDVTQPTPAINTMVYKSLKQFNTIVLLNKCDLAGPVPVAVVPENYPAIRVSAVTAEGLEELKAAVVRFAESFQHQIGDDLVAINARHTQALATAQQALATARETLARYGAAELVASDLRAALNHLGELTGKIDHDRVLDELFATFCIGK